MSWFFDWWNSLSLLQQTFAVVAIPATVMLILQTVLLLFGIGGSHDADHGEFFEDHSALDSHDMGNHDFDGEADAHDGGHHDVGLRVFTIRGMVAFFSVGGWLGIALGDTGLPAAAIIAIALAGGTAALLLTALFIRWCLSLQDQGNLELNNAIGKTAQVYIPIPAEGKGSGKVTLTLQERYVELSAITTAKATLRTDELVKVTGIVNQSTLVVKPVLEQSEED